MVKHRSTLVGGLVALLIVGILVLQGRGDVESPDEMHRFKPVVVYVVAMVVNLHSAPDVASPVLALLPFGTEMRLVGHQGDEWSEVIAPDPSHGKPHELRGFVVTVLTSPDRSADVPRALRSLTSP